MNRLIRFSAIMVIFFVTINMAVAQKTDKANLFTELYLSVNMDCLSCENKLTEQLKFEKGVRDLKCDFKSNTIYVKYKAGANSQERIVKSIEKLEYIAEVITKEQYNEKLKNPVNLTEKH